MATTADARLRSPEEHDKSLKSLARLAGGLFALLVVAIIVFLLLFQWNWLRGPIGRLASARLDREVRLVGDLDVRLLTWTPTATINDLRIADAPWRRAREPMVRIDRLTVATRWRSLIVGRVEFPLIQADRPVVNLLRDGQGRANWNFRNEPDTGEASRIPPIQNLLINDGRLDFRDQQRDIELTGTINSSERVDANGQGTFRLAGRGRLSRDPFTLDVTGGPLVNIRADRPYPLRADIRAGATRLTARGQIDRPFDMNQFRAAVTLQGDDLGQIYRITGLATPNSPPYRISGALRRDGRNITFNDFTGRVGDSDLGGDLGVRLGGDRPRVTADLRSRNLDFDDLLVIVGGPPDPNESANAAQIAQSRRMAAERRLLPDATLDTTRFRAVDAEVTYRADSVRASQLPLRGVSFHATLDNALLTVDRMTFAFPQGEVNGSARLNGRGATPVTDLDLRVRGIRLEALIPARGGSSPVEGSILARAQLRGTGNSVRRAAASADGQITVVVPRGRVRRAFAELAGVNVLPGLLQLLSGDQSESNLRCAVADFRVSNGIATSRTLVADTDVVLIRGGGSFSLRDETFRIRFEGDSKRPRLLRLFAPINVSGPIVQPRVGVEAGGIVAQGGIAVALGALISPLAVILPFVELGGADDANCGQLVQQANARGAPVAGAAAAVGGR